MLGSGLWALGILLTLPIRSSTGRVVHGDSGFCRPRVLRRLEHGGLHYMLGLQKNSRLQQHVEYAELALAEQRLFGEFHYAADSWDRPRRVIVRLEHGEQGANPRFIISNRPRCRHGRLNRSLT